MIQQASMLLDMPRSHVRNLGNNTPDTIASHCYQVSVIAYCLARMEGLNHEVGLKAMAMGTLHDLAEARTGDMDFVAKNYMKIDEAKAMGDQFAGLSFGQDLLGMMNEYEERESLEAKCVKDADILAQMYIEWVLVWRDSNPHEWWWSEFVDKGVNMEQLNGKK